MVREDLFEGLKVALSKGASLKGAMMSLFNAGYRKEDIEEAARYLVQAQQSVQPQPTQQVQSQVTQQPQTKPQPAQPVQQKVPVKPEKKPTPSSSQTTAQKVSAYEEKPKSTGAVVTWVLIFLLILLVGILAAIFVFKDEIADFFGGIF